MTVENRDKVVGSVVDKMENILWDCNISASRTLVISIVLWEIETILNIAN